MTHQNNAAQPLLTDDAIERIRIRAEKDSRRFGHTVDIPIRADLLLALLSKLRAPVADESPMAKMADALREKARQEQQAYQDRRNQATEWGPIPEGTEADSAHVAGEATDAELDKLYRETITEGPEDDVQLWDNPHRAYARAVLARYAAPQASEAVRDGTWPMLSELHLHALMFAYNEGYSKAYDGRLFPNPFSENGSQAAAWQLGTDDGTEARAALSAQPADKPAISSPSSAGNPCPAPVPAHPETGNSHTDGGAVYG